MQARKASTRWSWRRSTCRWSLESLARQPCAPPAWDLTSTCTTASCVPEDRKARTPARWGRSCAGSSCTEILGLLTSCSIKKEVGDSCYSAVSVPVITSRGCVPHINLQNNLTWYLQNEKSTFHIMQKSKNKSVFTKTWYKLKLSSQYTFLLPLLHTTKGRTRLISFTKHKLCRIHARQLQRD